MSTAVHHVQDDIQPHGHPCAWAPRDWNHEQCDDCRACWSAHVRRALASERALKVVMLGSLRPRATPEPPSL